MCLLGIYSIAHTEMSLLFMSAAGTARCDALPYMGSCTHATRSQSESEGYDSSAVQFE